MPPYQEAMPFIYCSIEMEYLWVFRPVILVWQRIHLLLVGMLALCIALIS